MTQMMDIATQIAQLEAQFKGAFSFFSKTRLANKQALSQLPWYILLGPPGAGKTSLLAHSHQRFILAKKAHRLAKQAITPTMTCDWWATEEAVYADLSGLFSAPYAQDQDLKLWQEIVRLFSKYQQKNPWVGVILVLSTDSFRTDREKLLKTASTIKNQLQSLVHSFNKSFPIHLIINQVDSLNGFYDFFYDLSQEERAQPWGFSCHRLTKAKAATSEWFDNPFEQLLAKLNAQLLFQLQRHTQLNKRAATYNFPMEVANLKPNLLIFLAQALTPELNWHSIHFASSGTKMRPQLPAHRPSLPALVEQPSSAVPYAPKTYFIDHLFQYFINQGLAQKLSSQYHSKRRALRLGYLGFSLLIATGVGAWTYEFKQQLTNAQQIEKALTEFQVLARNQTTPTLAYNIQLLDTLEQGTRLPTQWFIPVKIKKLHSAITQAYQLALQQLLLAPLIDLFEQALAKAPPTDPIKLYATLQAYLMLTDESHRQPDFIEAELINHWQQQADYQSSLLPNLHHHLLALLNQSLPALELNQTSIETARQQLAQVQPIKRAYAILNNSQWFQATTLYADPPLSAKAIKISSFYTTDALATIYPKQLIEACEQALLGNWVLDKLDSSQPIDLVAIHALQSQLSELYLTDYAQEWQRVITELAAFTLGEPEHLLQSLELLLNTQSKLHQALATIKTNSQIETLTQGYSTELAAKLSEKFSALANFTDHHSAWPNLETKLKQLQAYLLQMQQDEEVAYIAAKTRILAPSVPLAINAIAEVTEPLPEPWQTWLKEVAKQSWQYTLIHTANYLDKIWQAQVWAFYQQHIAQHFPFSTDLQAPEASLANFNQFFAPNGILDHYFSTYLKLFIDTAPTHWQLKLFDGQSLALSQQSLNALQQAAILQRMFYPQQQTKPQVKFSLAALAIDARINSLELIINDKILSYPTQTQNLELIWPADPSTAQVKLTYQDESGLHPITEFKGEWSLFRFLYQGTLAPMTDPRLSLIAFNADDNLLQFELYAQEPIHPFRRDLLANFKLPESIQAKAPLQAVDPL